MKKCLAFLLLLALLSALPAAASAEEPRPGVEIGGVTVTATGCSSTPGADGAPRLTVFLRAENKNDAPRALCAQSCLIGPCELPANLSCTLEAGESAEAMLVVPLTPLSYFDLSTSLTDFLRLRLAVSAPGGEAEPAGGAWLLLRVGQLPPVSPRERDGDELFRRFGVRVLTLGADWDGRVLTAWFLLENNNDFPLRLTGGLEGEAASPLCGGSVRGHSRAAFRVDVPTDIRPVARIFTLGCSLAGYADGDGREPVPMATFKASFHTREAEAGVWTVILAGECESENDQRYIERVGLRDFAYDECLPVYEIETEKPPLPRQESGLVSLACCGAYEVLAGTETRSGTLIRLPLTLRSFTGEGLSLRLQPPREGLGLPCLTTQALCCGPNGSASAEFLFDTGSLAYTGLAGDAGLTHAFTLLVGPADDPERSFGVHPAERTCAITGGIEPAEAVDFPETPLGALSFRLLGLDVSDGLSLWLEVKNTGDAELPFGSARMDAILNSTAVELLNSGPSIPAHAQTLVLLRGAVFSPDGAADPFAFRTPPLTDFNTLKLRLAEDMTLTLMFRQNGDLMFANAA